MAYYRISITGVAFIEAENEEIAEELFWAGMSDREEYEVEEVEEMGL